MVSAPVKAQIGQPYLQSLYVQLCNSARPVSTSQSYPPTPQPPSLFSVGRDPLELFVAGRVFGEGRRGLGLGARGGVVEEEVLLVALGALDALVVEGHEGDLEAVRALLHAPHVRGHGLVVERLPQQRPLPPHQVVRHPPCLHRVPDRELGVGDARHRGAEAQRRPEGALRQQLQAAARDRRHVPGVGISSPSRASRGGRPAAGPRVRAPEGPGRKHLVTVHLARA
eukprot:1489325-Rhodomonas_salina.2